MHSVLVTCDCCIVAVHMLADHLAGRRHKRATEAQRRKHKHLLKARQLHGQEDSTGLQIPPPYTAAEGAEEGHSATQARGQCGDLEQS